MEHPWRGVDWDSVRIFLLVDRHRSFRAASDALGIGVNTVRNAIGRLEDQLGYKLFYRDVGGVRLTAEGRRVISSAREVEQSMSDMWRVAQTSATTRAGPIYLAITEGLGSFWLTPRLTEFMESDDGRDVQINLQCAMRSVDVLRLEADISVQLTEPSAPELIKRRLGYLHTIPFASRSYLEKYGTPRTIADLINHRLVVQQTEQLQHIDFSAVFGIDLGERIVKLNTNFASAHYWAIAKGAGIGLLPNYAIAIGADVVPVDIDLVFRVDIWMSLHPEVRKTARHRAFIDWLADSFSDRRFPWFGESFMPPSAITEHFSQSDLATYFRGLTPIYNYST
ncbi:LysR family transcriptional regulator [Jiella sp. MQZ9-1]|uniref:LysR family transcriptional regulator n=1 Tax=Jiella flava TaxID=2816857 RepID=A0A939FV25_9HYPH|nr:LysR family transcriptional regulator [Jiella flava]MBO0662483.1 LysR family transcriptional regulator [Jiella flava]MCD2471708.1 LysR family transcriptional regulator [Jiella flava]